MVAALAARHDEDQDGIATELMFLVGSAWGLMDFTRLDDSIITFAQVVIPQVRTAYYQSQRVSAVFNSNVRFASVVDEPLPIVLPDVQRPLHVPESRFNLAVSGPTTLEPIVMDEFPLEDVQKSLYVEANYDVKRAMPGDPTEVMENAKVNTQGAAIRQALKGARNATNNVVSMDRKVLGYARFTDVNPCPFCALLASRGAVYKLDSFKGGNVSQSRQGFTKGDQDFALPADAPEVPAAFSRIAKVHNHCRCTLRPVYTKSQSLDEEAKFYRKQWNDAADYDDYRENYVPFAREPAEVISLTEELQERETALLNAGFSPASPQVQWATTASALLA